MVSFRILPVLLLLVIPAAAQPADDGPTEEELFAALGGGYAEYAVSGGGAWADVLEGQNLLLMWTQPHMALDAHGQWVPAHGLLSMGPSFDGTQWNPVDIELRTYSFEERHLLARMTDDFGEHAGSGTTLFGMVDSYQAGFDGSLDYTFLADGSQDCLITPSSWKDMDCILPLVPHLEWVHENQHLTRLEDGRDALVVHARSGPHLLQFWYSEDVPYAERIVLDAIISEGQAAQLELRLVDHEPPAEWDVDDALASDVPSGFEPLRIKRGEKFNNVLYSFNEEDTTHPFPLTAAVRGLWSNEVGDSTIIYEDRDGPDRCGNDPTPHTSADDFLRGRQQPFVFHAEYAYVSGDYESHHWLIGMTDGRRQEWVELVRYMEGRPMELAVAHESRCGRWGNPSSFDEAMDHVFTAFDGSLSFLLGPPGHQVFAYYVDSPMEDQHLPLIASARTSLPGLQDLMARWEALASEENMTANSYGFHVGCGSCDRRHWQIWAGQVHATATVEGPFFQPNVTHEGVSSLLRMDLSGRLLSVEESMSADWFAAILDTGTVPGDGMSGGAFPVMRPLSATRILATPAQGTDAESWFPHIVAVGAITLAAAVIAARRR